MHKAERKGIDAVDVVVGTYDSLRMRDLSYHCVVELRAGKSRLRLSHRKYNRSGNLAEVVIQKAVIEQRGLEDAIEAAKQLQERGFRSFINGMPLDGAQEILALHKEAIEIQRQKLAYYL